MKYGRGQTGRERVAGGVCVCVCVCQCVCLSVSELSSRQRQESGITDWGGLFSSANLEFTKM